MRSIIGPLAIIAMAATSTPLSAQRARARDLGVKPGVFTPGALNAITDVAGVRVGQTTVVEGANVRTGVTAILPRGRDSIETPAFAGSFVLNGAGEMTGRAWIEESGMLDGPVMLTNTHSVGVVRDAGVRLRDPSDDPLVLIDVGKARDDRLGRVEGAGAGR